MVMRRSYVMELLVAISIMLFCLSGPIPVSAHRFPFAPLPKDATARQYLELAEQNEGFREPQAASAAYGLALKRPECKEGLRLKALEGLVRCNTWIANEPAALDAFEEYLKARGVPTEKEQAPISRAIKAWQLKKAMNLLDATKVSWKFQLEKGMLYFGVKQFDRAQRCFESASALDLSASLPKSLLRLTKTEMARGSYSPEKLYRKKEPDGFTWF
jgi:tetratricopeptide (TPR) repeat protein